MILTKVHHDPRSPAHVLAELALDLAKLNGKVTADDLRNLAPNTPNKTANIGAAFRSLIKRGELVFVCYQRSQFPWNHGRRIGVYSPPMKVWKNCP